jgi:hypothetical protein
LAPGLGEYRGFSLYELPRSKLRGISLAEFIDLIEASFEELNPQRLKEAF